MGRYTGGRHARTDALLSAALSDLGERGTVDYGYAFTRGSRRVWRAGAAHPESVRVGIGYALHASCTLAGDASPTMHYARTDARDATRMGSRQRGRIAQRVGVRVDVRDPDSGRKLVGAIVTGAARATGAWAATTHADARIERVRHDARIRTLRDAGCGL
jgi:hypothetical protein